MPGTRRELDRLMRQPPLSANDSAVERERLARQRDTQAKLRSRREPVVFSTGA